MPEYPTGHFLNPNGLGGYIVRQSDLQSFSRCALQKFYEDRGRKDPTAPQREELSATVYGSVVHYALMVMERLHSEGRDDALAAGLETFKHYWHQQRANELPGVKWVTEWLPRDTYGGLREDGITAIENYYETLTGDKSRLLALEYTFAVPISVGDGRVHTLTGTVDRLALRTFYGKPYLSIDDFKTGRKPRYLRYNVQGSAYAYASTLGEFWMGWDEHPESLPTFGWDVIDALERAIQPWKYRLFNEDDPQAHENNTLMPRRFQWLDMARGVRTDGGWRIEKDHEHLFMAVHQYIRACEAGVYFPATSGEICRYCDFRNVCGGVGLPEEKEGAPK